MGFQRYRAHAYHSTLVSVDYTTNNELPFDTEELDVGALHDPASNSHRLTIPTGGKGRYDITGNITYSSLVNTSNNCSFSLAHGIPGSVTSKQTHQRKIDNGDPVTSSLSYAVTLDMNDGDYLYFSVAPSGFSDTVDIKAGPANTFLIASRIGA